MYSKIEITEVSSAAIFIFATLWKSLIIYKFITIVTFDKKEVC